MAATPQLQRESSVLSDASPAVSFTPQNQEGGQPSVAASFRRRPSLSGLGQASFNLQANSSFLSAANPTPSGNLADYDAGFSYANVRPPAPHFMGHNTDSGYMQGGVQSQA